MRLRLLGLGPPGAAAGESRHAQPEQQRARNASHAYSEQSISRSARSRTEGYTITPAIVSVARPASMPMPVVVTPIRLATVTTSAPR
jgi:hypothetical protein